MIIIKQESKIIFCIYEISKVYDENYNEDTLLTILMKGNLVTTSWNSNSFKK